MKENRKNIGRVPNLRFPEFTGEWEVTSLGNECTINPKVPSLENEFVYVDLESVVKGMLTNTNHINKSEAPSRAQRVLSDKDILFQCVRPYQLNNYIYHRQDNKQWVASTGYAQIRTKHNIYFLYQLLNSPQFNQEVILRCTGTSYPAISSTDLGNIPISICSDEEQKKIGKLLSLVDERGATQSKIIDRLESLINWVADFLLNNKDANIKLKDCLNCHSSTLMESMIQNNLGEHPVYGATGVIAYSGDYKIDEDTILIIKDGASVGRVQYAKGKHSVIGTLNYLTPKGGISLKYMYYYLRMFNFDKYKVGSGIPHIYFKDYGHEYIYCPPIEDQQKIVSVLSAIDEKIEIEKKIREQFIEQKKHLLKQMFI